MKEQIENAIRQHLIITNPVGVKYAVDRIADLFNSELARFGILAGEDAERFIEKANNPVMVPKEEVERMKASFDSIMAKSKGIR